jgi:hypothetical protein
MSLKILRSVGVLLLFMTFPSSVLSLDTVEEEKINTLIRFVSGMKEEKFIRNGVEYDTEKAVKMIQYKYDKEKAHLKNATDFIERCATKSSTTGRPYQIKFPNGVVRNSEEVLKEKLKELENTKTATGL